MSMLTTLYPRLPNFVDPTIEELETRIAKIAKDRDLAGTLLNSSGPKTSVEMPSEFAVVLREWKDLQARTPARSRSAFRQWDSAIGNYQSLVKRFVQLSTV